MDKAKGLVQVLWERGFNRWRKYEVILFERQKNQLDKDGKLKKKLNIVFHASWCQDALTLPTKSRQQSTSSSNCPSRPSRTSQCSPPQRIITKWQERESDSYEVNWNTASIVIHWNTHTHTKFNKCVRDSIKEYLRKENVVTFLGFYHCYMMEHWKYNISDNKATTFGGIEKYPKRTKAHCNVSEIEKGLIEGEYAAI